MPVHTVRQGETVFSLSKQYGVPPDKIRDHADNRALQQDERDVGILFPGDHITIPDPESKEIAAATEQRHQFRCHIGRARLRVRFMDRDDPRADEPYTLIVDLDESTGNLDQDGWLDVTIPADARSARIRLGEGDTQDEFELQIGDLNPITELSGVKQRLNNLGFFCGEEDDHANDDLAEALRIFQAKNDLQVSGELDDTTRQRLQEVYGR